jgi:hypothetical protein
MFTALPSPEPPKPRRGEMYLLACNHLAPLWLEWFWAGQGYKHGAPTELNERREFN